METMGISAFKARALKVIGKVAATKERVVVLKRGKPVAEIVPYRKAGHKPVPGKLSAALVLEKDIVSPLGEDIWEACR
jgi:prevent-host-death family protein